MASTPVLTEVPSKRTNESRIATIPQPLAEKERIVSIDALRGFALLGILPMNIQYFSMISAAYQNPTAYGDLRGANYWVWLLSHVLADEKFMTIFSMLFGAGILLMTSRIEATGKPSAILHYRRMGWLILFGLAHAYLLWSGDILGRLWNVRVTGLPLPQAPTAHTSGAGAADHRGRFRIADVVWLMVATLVSGAVGGRTRAVMDAHPLSGGQPDRSLPQHLDGSDEVSRAGFSADGNHLLRGVHILAGDGTDAGRHGTFQAGRFQRQAASVPVLDDDCRCFVRWYSGHTVWHAS